jgi:hypothetical protein
MKKIVFSLTLLLFLVKSFSQTPALSKDYYLKKSKTQKTVAWVMLGGGVAMATIGLIIVNKQVNDDPFNTLNNLGTVGGSAILGIVGIGSALGSIPFFISSAKNARRAAAAISFNNQKILFPLQNNFVLKTQPALTLKIEL